MKIISLILILTICCPLLAQDDAATTPGNARDQAAVDQAINGWWTAALKNRDERLAWWRLYATAAALPAPSGQLNAPQPFQAILAAMNKYLARSNNSGGLAETTKGRPTK